MSDWLQDFMKTEALIKRLYADFAMPNNKAQIFDALEAAGIAMVIVHYDGAGDSGQIEEISAYAQPTEPGDWPAPELPLPDATVKLVRIERYAKPNPKEIECQASLNEALEQMTYDLLEQVHGGWQNNEGAFGDFVYATADRSIRMEHNTRIESTEYYEAEW